MCVLTLEPTVEPTVNSKGRFLQHTITGATRAFSLSSLAEFEFLSESLGIMLK